MENSRLFRVFDRSEERIKLNPVTRDDQEVIEAGGELKDIAVGPYEPGVEKILSLVEPGHLIRATIDTSTDPARFESIEHQGGFTLEELDNRFVPYIIRKYWEMDESPGESEEVEQQSTIPLSSIEAPNQEADFIGELIINPTSAPEAPLWDELKQGIDSESMFGEFEAISERPEEVFIGKSSEDAYWYVLLFPAERTTIARRIRAQYGELHDDKYLPNLAWDLSKLVNMQNLPNHPDNDPLEIFASDVRVSHDALPPQFGSKTIELITELVYVGSEFELTLLGGESDSLDTENPLTYSAEEFLTTEPGLINTYRFYTTLLTEIFEHHQVHPDTDVELLIAQDVLPSPELLYRAEHRLISLIAEFEAYFKKMRQVPVESYVVNKFSGASPRIQREINEEFHVEGFPLTIRHILYDLEFQLEDISEVLKIGPYVANAKRTRSGFQYEIQAEQKAYYFIQQHQEKISDHLTPADLGGKGTGIFMDTLGRIGQRHNWLDISSLGGIGALLGQSGELM